MQASKFMTAFSFAFMIAVTAINFLRGYILISAINRLPCETCAHSFLAGLRARK